MHILLIILTEEVQDSKNNLNIIHKCIEQVSNKLTQI